MYVEKSLVVLPTSYRPAKIPSGNPRRILSVYRREFSVYRRALVILLTSYRPTKILLYTLGILGGLLVCIEWISVHLAGIVVYAWGGERLPQECVPKGRPRHGLSRAAGAIPFTLSPETKVELSSPFGVFAPPPPRR